MSVLQSNNMKSEKVRFIDRSGSIKFRPGEREQIVMYLIRVCSRMDLPDQVLHLTVMLLDRYREKVRTAVPTAQLQQIFVALLSIAFKVIGAPPNLYAILTNLGQGQFTCEDVHRTEVTVLEVLQFDVATPTLLEALESRLVPFVLPGETESSSVVAILAKFMVEMSLLHAPLHYQYSHAVLAAGAVYAALSCSQPVIAQIESLLQDTAEICGRPNF